MSADSEDPPIPEKRTDVGYKRPPLEHRFKPGQKPPPRRKRTPPTMTPAQLLQLLLRERRHVVDTDGKAKWMAVGEIIMRNAWTLAEKGNLSIRRRFDQLVLKDPPEERPQEMPRIVLKPDSKVDRTIMKRLIVKD